MLMSLPNSVGIDPARANEDVLKASGRLNTAHNGLTTKRPCTALHARNTTATTGLAVECSGSRRKANKTSDCRPALIFTSVINATADGIHTNSPAIEHTHVRSEKMSHTLQLRQRRTNAPPSMHPLKSRCVRFVSWGTASHATTARHQHDRFGASQYR